MAELTQQDLDNYNKLKKAFEKITKTNQTDLVIEAIKTLITGNVKNTEELSAIVNPLYSYWKVLSSLGKPLQFSDLEQQFSDSIENLKRSLKVLEDRKVDLTDGIEDFQPDSLFLKFIEGEPKQFTTNLIKDRDTNLTEKEIDQLTQAWAMAVSDFVKHARTLKSARKVEVEVELEPGQPDTFVHFFRIHKELEILYSRLANTETVQSSR
jgi:hypothetical protein